MRLPREPPARVGVRCRGLEAGPTAGTLVAGRQAARHFASCSGGRRAGLLAQLFNGK